MCKQHTALILVWFLSLMHITFKLEKAEILEKTISYIKALQDLTEDVKADCETESLEAKGESVNFCSHKWSVQDKNFEF